MSFDNSSENYLKSSDHSFGEDVDYVSKYFKNIEFQNQLDIATAAGHFCRFFNSRNIFATDISFNMLKTARKSFNLDFVIQCASEYLPFKANSFDLITCRIALHHFVEPGLFFKEVWRCLVDKGIFVLIDSIVDVEDAYLNCIEYIRDNSHIRSYTMNEIMEFTNNLFRLENYLCTYKKHNFDEWARRLNNSDANVNEVQNEFFILPDKIKKELQVVAKKDKILSYTDKKGVFIFKKL